MLQAYLVRTTDVVLIRVSANLDRAVKRAFDGRTALRARRCVEKIKGRMATFSILRYLSSSGVTDIHARLMSSVSVLGQPDTCNLAGGNGVLQVLWVHSSCGLPAKGST